MEGLQVERLGEEGVLGATRRPRTGGDEEDRNAWLAGAGGGNHVRGVGVTRSEGCGPNVFEGP